MASKDYMIIDCVSDLHGFLPKLDCGDLLIIAGDLTARDRFEEYCKTFHWIANQKYRKKIVIGGNHDNLLQTDDWFAKMTIDFDYLCDSGTEFEGLKIWGSPWTKTFEGMNPKCKAFTVDTEKELVSKFSLIPDDIDILVTHGPPYGMQDVTIYDECVGSKSLQMELWNRLSPKLLIFGHIHEAYGKSPPGLIEGCEVINCSLVNEHYEHVNKPIRVIL